MRVSVIIIILFATLGFSCESCIRLNNFSHWLIERAISDRNKNAFRAKFEYLGLICLGKDPAFVRTILGEPRSVDKRITIEGFPSAAATADRNWLYEEDAQCYVVSFQNKKCIAIEPYSYTRDARWQRKRAKLIAHWCIGKSLEQVLEGLGRTKCNLRDVPKISKASGALAWEQDCDYLVGGSTSVYIKFEGGRCVEADGMLLFH